MSRKFFIEKQIEDVKEIHVNGNEFNHIVNALRHHVGDEITLCDENGVNYICTISKIEKTFLEASVKDVLFNVNEPDVDMCVAVASLKGEKIDFLSQKLCELGVNDFVIFYSQNSEVPVNEKRLERMLKISAEATKQCGRSKIMQVNISKNLQTLCETLNTYDIVLLAYEKSNCSLKSELSNIKAKKVAIILGSEGGFEQKEVDYIIKTIPQTKAISLGKRILRAETACIALASACMYELKELS